MRNWLKSPDHQLALTAALAIFGLLVAFVVQHMPHYPIEQMAWHNSWMALLTHEGRLTMQDILMPFFGHRHAVDYVETVALTLLTDWDIRYEYGLLLANAFVSWALMVSVYARADRKRVHLVLVPFALLMFATQQGDTWLIPHAMWQQSLLCFVVGWWALFNISQDWPALAVMLVSYGLGLFTLASGIAALPVMAVGLWLGGRRRLLWPYLLIAGVMTAVYLLNAPFTVSAETTGTETITMLTVPPIGKFIAYLFAYMGGPVAAHHTAAAIVLGVMVVAVSLLNWGYLARAGQHTQALAWVMMGLFAVATGGLMAAGRYRFGLESAYLERYTVLSSTGWIGAVALAVIVLAHLNQQERAALWARLWGSVNVLLLVAAGVGYVLTAYTGTPIVFELWETDRPLTTADVPSYYTCTEAFPLSRTLPRHCALGNGYADTVIDRLAAYNMGGFQHRPRQNVLLDAYRSGDPILLHSDNAWHTVHMRDFWLDGVPVTDTFHYVPADQMATVDEFFGYIPQPPVHMTADPATVQTWLGARSVVWVMSGPNAGGPPLDMDEYVLLDTYNLDYGITLSGYVREADMVTANVPLDDRVTLRSWRVLEPLTRAACEPLTLVSTWGATDTLPDGLKLTFVMSDADGEGVTRSDVYPPIRAGRWQTGEVYAVRQTFDVPCDVDTGEYPLFAGAYVADGAGVESVGELVYLTDTIVR